MNLSDIFGQDIFSSVSLGAAIEKLPQQPSKLGDMGIFEQEPINTTVALVEEYQGKLALVQTSQRGTRTAENVHAKRVVTPFIVPHLQQNDTVKPDEVLGIRQFGESVETLMTVAKMINRRLQQMKNNLDATREWHRVGAIQGIVYDADTTSVIYNYFTQFGGISRDSVQFDFTTTPSTDVKGQAQKVTRLLIKNLGQMPYNGIIGICGDNFWDAFITSVSVKEAYKNYASNTMLQQQQRDGFMFADIYWINYSAWVGSLQLMPTEQCQFFPKGASGLFKEFLAPADTSAAVGTLGLPYYASQEILPHDKGVDLEAQTNPLFMCTRPKALIQGTHT